MLILLEVMFFIALIVIAVIVVLSKKKKVSGKDTSVNQKKDTSINVADELQKYGDLFEQGSITKEEYDQIKNKLLNK
jgi:uncharacterized membrane protein